MFLQNNPWVIFLILAWTLPWKGYALWKSAKRGQNWWFIVMFLINDLAILEILYIFVFSKKKGIETVAKRENIKKLNEERGSVKKGRKEKILNILKKEGKITNNKIESLLGVSDATATNYLQELENEGKIEQVGGTGRGVFYRLKK